MLMLDLNALEVQSFPTTEGEAIDATLPFASTKGPMCTCVSCTDRPPDCTETIDRPQECVKGNAPTAIC